MQKLFQEFEVLQLAPSGTDFVVQQEVKLKTFYNEVVLGAMGGSPEQGGVMPLGPQGMMMKMMVDGMMKQPMPPPFTFTGGKLINDLDERLVKRSRDLYLTQFLQIQHQLLLSLKQSQYLCFLGLDKANLK